MTAGSSAALTGNTISQNLVGGEGVPVAQLAPPTTRTSRSAAGVRLVGAQASSATRNNIVDNAYGAINAELDGTTPNESVPFAAENNWWGLRPGAGGDAPEPRPGDLADDQPAVPGEPRQRVRAARRHGHELDRGRLLPAPQRRAGRRPDRRVHRLRRPAARRRRRPDRLAVARQVGRQAQGDGHADRARRRRLRRQVGHVLRRRHGARHGHAAALYGVARRSPRTRVRRPHADRRGRGLARPDGVVVDVAHGRLHRHRSEPADADADADADSAGEAEPSRRTPARRPERRRERRGVSPGRSGRDRRGRLLSSARARSARAPARRTNASCARRARTSAPRRCASWSPISSVSPASRSRTVDDRALQAAQA